MEKERNRECGGGDVKPLNIIASSILQLGPIVVTQGSGKDLISYSEGFVDCMVWSRDGHLIERHRASKFLMKLRISLVMDVEDRTCV